METLLQLATTCAVILYILCDTTALETYLKTIFKWLRIRSDVVNPEKSMGLSFIMRLRMKYPSSFWVSLLECPVCLGVWFGTAGGVLLFGLNILALGTSVFLTWLFYYILRVLVSVINKNESEHRGKI